MIPDVNAAHDLCFPCGRPLGYDPQHPGAAATPGIPQLSCFPVGNRFLNILGVALGGGSGSPVYGVMPVGGPGIHFAASSTDATTFSWPTTAFSAATMAFIYISDPTPGAISDLGGDSNGNGDGFDIAHFTGASENFVARWGGGGSFTNISTFMATSVPIFVVVSAKSGGPFNCVARRLDTGQIFSQVTSFAGNGTGGTATLTVGNRSDLTGTRSAEAWIFAMMRHQSYLTLGQQTQWAQSDPWSYWFPNRAPIVVKTPAAAGSPVVFRKTLSQLGGRVGSRQPQKWAA